MKKTFLRLLAGALLTTSISAQTLPNAPIMGFSGANSQRQKTLENQFDAALKNEDLRGWMKRLSERPHHVGSAYGKENAEFMVSLLKSWGFDAQLESYDVLFPTPKTRLLEMTAPQRFVAKLAEPALKEDATSGQKTEQLPTYNAYSIDGDVTGDLVYVNYGVPADYEELEKRGVDVRGKIVIARYGGSWRGIKPKVAAEHGAIGCLIYSDPRDDGFYQGDVYPKGSWRNENGAQRGSVADMPLFPGDPLTPNEPSIAGTKRLDRKNAPTLTKIPVMPISYADALPLMKNLGGQIAPANWRGALPVTYHIGGVNAAKVHFKLAFNWETKKIYNVIGKITGAERPDEWIIRGNHHDAWVNGADDPISGLVAELAEAKALGELLKTGWKPKRTIVYCAWDGEEPGLLGSTEWVEQHAEELKEKAVVYINSDSNGRGFLGMGGSHTLEKFINQVAQDVNDPQTNVSVWRRLRSQQLVGGNANSRRELNQRPDLRIGALGSGSDFTPFLQHLGIASLNIGFGGEDGGGSYHSVYDSFDHFTRFVDPKFDYGIALAKVGGHSVLRFADADVVPFEFTNFADTLGQYVNEITKMTDAMREETAAMNQMIADGTLKSTYDPQQKLALPKPQAAVPAIDFKTLTDAVEKLQKSADRYQRELKDANISAERQKNLDAILYKSERFLTDNRGLPRRDWFKHQIYAPGFYTGYGVKTIPGVREAVEQRNWSEAQAQIRQAAQTIENFAAEIDKASKIY